MRPSVLYAGTLLLAIITASCRSGGPSRVEAPADSVAGAVAFDMIGPGGAAVAVPVHLNGRGPFQFVLDTGATLTCANQNLADSLALPESAGQIGVGAGVGSAGSVRLVSVDSIRVGQATAFDLTACVLDLAQLETAGLRVDGLLGLNFLKSFRVTLDFANNTLHMQAY